MKNALTLYQSDIVLKKEPRSYPRLWTLAHGIVERQQQDMLISQQERSKNRVAAVYSLQGSEKKGKDCRSWTSEGSCSKGGTC